MHIYKLKMRKRSHKTSCHQTHFQNQKCAKMRLLRGSAPDHTGEEQC